MVATTLPAVVRVVDLPTGTTVTGAELFEVVQTSAGVGQSVQLSLNQINALVNIPTAGNTGQILNKSSGANYSTQWSNITQFVAVGTSLATTGSATSIVVFVPNNGIGSAQLATFAVVGTSIATGAVGSTQIANNAVGTNQIASSLGIASSLSIGTLLTVGGTTTITGTTILNGGLQVSGTSILTGTFGVVGTSQFTGAFNVVGTTFITGVLNQVGTSLMTGMFGISGTALFTSTFGVVGTSQFTGAFNVVGTTTVTGVVGVIGTSQFTGAYNVTGTSQFTGVFGVNGSATFTSGLFGIVGTTLVTGAFVLGNSTTGIMWSSATGVISATTNIATGLVVTVFNVGNATTGTITPSPLNGNYQYVTNNGAFTVAAYTTFDFALDLLIQNGTTPGAITFSGWRAQSVATSAFTTAARAIQSAVVATGSPGIVTSTAHASNVGDPVWFSTSGNLPTGMSSGTIYYISTTAANTFQIATTAGTTTSINLSSTQAGTHTATFPSQYLASLRSIHFVPTIGISALQ